MKPIMLSIAGLHSFRELQSIDFTKVTDTGIFGIFGPTGSGKSTILDAMTLALYGKVERSGGNRHGILNQHEPQLHVGFTFEIAHHDGRRRYRVERTYKRKDAYSVQSVHARLLACESGGDVVLEDKETAVTEGIRRLIGLNADDFTRAVVLPQGKFEEFLQLRGKERRDMLERIFRLDTFGEVLRQEAIRYLQQLTGEVERLVSQQEMLGEATHEAVKEAKQAYEEAVQIRHRLEREKTIVDREYDAWKVVRQHQQELAAIENKLNELEVERAEIETLERALDKAARADQMAPFIRTYREWEIQVKRTAAQLKQAKRSTGELAAKREAARAAHEQAQDEWEEKSPSFLEQKVNGQHAVEWEREQKTLAEKRANQEKTLTSLKRQHDECERHVQQNVTQIHALETEINRIAERLAAISVTNEERQQVRIAETALKELSVKQNQCDQAVRRYEEKQAEQNKIIAQWAHVSEELEKREEKLERLRNQRQRVIEQQPFLETDLQARQVDLRERGNLIEQILSLSSEVQKAEKDIQGLESEIGRLESKRKRSLDEMDRIQRELTHKQMERTSIEKKIAEHERHHLAAQLVQKLTAGEPCPVCGAREHPQPASLTDEETVPRLKKTLKRVNDALTTLENERVQLKTEHSGQESALTHKKDWLEKTREDQQAKRQQLDELQRALPDPYRNGIDHHDLQAILTAEQKEWTEDYEMFNHWQETVKRLDTDLEKCQDTYHHWREKKIAAEAARKNGEVTIQEAKQAVEECEDERQAARASWEAVKGQWTVQSLAQRTSEIAAWDEEREQLEQQREQMNRKREERQQQLEQARDKLNGFVTELRKKESEQQHLQQQIAQLHKKIHTVTGGKPAQHYLQDIEKSETLLRQRVHEAQVLFQELERVWQEAQQTLTALEAKILDQKKQLATATAKVQHQLEKLRFVTIEEAEEANLTETETSQMQQKVNDYKDLWKQLQYDRNRVQAQLGGKTLSEDDWRSITEKKQALDEKLDEARDHVIHCQNAYETKVKEFEQWKALEKKRIAKQKEVDHASDLCHVLRGNAFVEFIAREQLIRIAADASKHLGELTRYRYALEIEQDGGFIMRDDANGGLRRPVSTLSGGETFLTSLSLALALSSQIQLKGECPLEFFFLDEGFGTLDPDLLDVVISSLENLHFKHMAIGLISHVPELQNRLHRKILVTGPDAGRGTEVRVAKA